MSWSPTDWVREKFSFSKMACFAQCPRKAFLRYVMRQKQERAEFFIYGDATHSGQEHDNTERIAGRRPPRKEVLDRAAQTYKEQKGADLDGFVRDHDIQLEKFWSSGERDRIQPVKDTVEGVFQVQVDVTPDPDEEETKPALIEGYVDVVSQNEDDTRSVVDYKTMGRAVSDIEAAKSDQLALYQLGSQVEKGRVVSFIKRGRQKPGAKVTKDRTVSESRLTRLMTFIADAIGGFRRALKTGDWPKCSPSCHWCGPDVCEFYSTCYPAKDPELEKYVKVVEVKPTGSLPQPEWRRRSEGGEAKEKVQG